MIRRRVLEDDPYPVLMPGSIRHIHLPCAPPPRPQHSICALMI